MIPGEVPAMVWQLAEQLRVIRDVEVRATAFQAKLTAAGRDELGAILQRANDRRLLIALKLIFGRKPDAALLSDFGVWLVLQGRVAFERALADPDTLTELEDPRGISALGRFAFTSPTTGPKWDDAEIRRRLPKLVARHLGDADRPDPRGALAALLRRVWARRKPYAVGDAFTLTPSEVHGIQLVQVEPGDGFDRCPAEAALLWEAMRAVEHGVPWEIPEIGVLTRTDRQEFTAWDAALGRERTVPGKTVYTLRLTLDTPRSPNP